MIVFLRFAFACVLVAMLCVTSWASSVIAVWKLPRELATHPWFIATLFDTYFAFLTFWLWLAWKERTWLPRVAWLVATARAGPCRRLTPLIAPRQPTARAATDWYYWRSVRLPVACGGDDYAFVPPPLRPAAPTAFAETIQAGGAGGHPCTRKINSAKPFACAARRSATSASVRMPFASNLSSTSRIKTRFGY